MAYENWNAVLMKIAQEYVFGWDSLQMYYTSCNVTNFQSRLY